MKKSKEDVIAYIKTSGWKEYFVENLKDSTFSGHPSGLSLEEYVNWLYERDILSRAINKAFCWAISNSPANTSQNFWQKIDSDFVDWFFDQNNDPFDLIWLSYEV